MRDKQKVEKHQFRWGWTVMILAGIVGGYFLYVYHAEQTRPQVQAEVSETNLRVVPVEAQNIVLEKKYIGYVTPINEVDILPYINGFIQQIDISGGQEVKAGDSLLMISQEEYKARVDAAQAQVLQTEADLANAKVYFERVKKVGSKAMSKTEYDNAKAKYLSAGAAAAQAKANYELARVNYNYTEINAPIAGMIGEVTLSKGDYVSPGGAPLLSIIQYDPIRVVFSITDKDYLEELQIGKLFANDKIKLRLADGKTYAYAGQYQYADNKLDRATNSIAVYADFANPDKTLVSNAYVDVLVEKNYDNVVLLKKELVTVSDAGNYVYLVNGNKLQKAPVTILGEQDDNYILQNNFKSGDYVVMDKVSPQISSSGIKINVVNSKAGKEKM